MATTTPNLGLVKPDYEDLADIAVLNDNSDTIDAAVKAVQDSVSSKTHTESTYGFVARKFGKVVVIRAESVNVPPSGEIIATLPSDMRPQERTSGFACCAQGASIQFTVNTNGTCHYYYTVSTTITYPRANLSFIVA